jgi:hypothetical protein
MTVQKPRAILAIPKHAKGGDPMSSILLLDGSVLVSQ